MKQAWIIIAWVVLWMGTVTPNGNTMMDEFSGDEFSGDEEAVPTFHDGGRARGNAFPGMGMAHSFEASGGSSIFGAQVNPNNPFDTPNRQGARPSVQNVKIMLGRWKRRISENEQNPELITAPLSALKKERTQLTEVLKTMRGAPQASVNELLLMRDLLYLAAIRQYTATLPDVEQGFLESYNALIAESPQELKLRPDKDDDNGEGQPVEWYQKRAKTIAELLHHFDIPLQQLGSNEPPLLLTGLRDSIKAGIETYNRYQQFIYSLHHPDDNHVQKFVGDLEKGPDGEGRENGQIRRSRRNRGVVQFNTGDRDYLRD